MLLQMMNAFPDLIDHLCGRPQRGTVLHEIKAFGNDLREKRVASSG